MEDIQNAILRCWSRGEVMGWEAGEFPLRIVLTVPSSREMGLRLPDVMRWIGRLEQGSSLGYTIERTERTTRQLGENPVPTAVIFAALDAVLHAVGKREDYARWQGLVATARSTCPELVPWVLDNPLIALSHADDWERLTRLLAWLLADPPRGLYYRQIDIPGLDTKFTEARLPIIRRLLAEVLPDDGTGDVLERFNFRRKPALIQVRSLDPVLQLGGVRHLAAPVEDLAQASWRPRVVVITENEINGLTIPAIAGAVVVFGRGIAVDVLGDLPWVRQAEVYYWGDIDSHGFAILDRLRALSLKNPDQKP